MRAAYRVQFTLEGRPFHVRRDRIVSIGLGLQPGNVVLDEDQKPMLNMEGTDYIREEPTEQVVLSVEGLGNVPIDESLEAALTIWDGITRLDDTGDAQGADR